MFIISKTKARFTSYKKELIGIGLTVAFVFVGLSLYSFDPNDPSWFFHSTHIVRVHNLCGVIGAHVAGILMYLFGLGSYFLIPSLLFMAYLQLSRRAWRDEWERYGAAVGIVIVMSALCTMHAWTLYEHGMPGGIVGFYSARFLFRLFDRIGTLLFLYSLLLISLVLLFRFSFMRFVSYMVSYCSRMVQICIKYKVVSRCMYGLRVGIELLMQPFIIFAKFSARLVDGTAFDFHADAKIDIHDAHKHSSSLVNTTLYDRFSFQRVPSAAQMVDVQDEVSDAADEGDELERQTSAQKNKDIQETDVAAYGLPNLDVFIGVDSKKEDALYKTELQDRAKTLEEKLERFGVCGKVIAIKSGPVVTLFEYQPEIDTKLSRILSLEDDLALALQALSIRIIAPIPGRSVVGFEVSNKDRKDVLLAHVIQSDEYKNFKGSLPLILGEDTIGNNVVVDLAKMPHLLVAGSTGSGKSVALNTMLMSLLCKCTPDQLKLILIDPKRLEFASYADIAHLLFPIITDPRKTAPILKWVVQQMEERYEKMARFNARNVYDYNERAVGMGLEYFPYIVVVIDELSDLMLSVGREIEDLITRITQMARAAGIHMIVATQRPSVDVITGLIKVNFPSRVSFRVTSKVDSRTILDCGGADKLLGRGDMLFLDSTASLLRRVHGAYVSNREIDQVVSHIRSQQLVEYLDITEQLRTDDEDISEGDETLFMQVIDYLQEIDEISISSLQRKFRIGYNRSARIIDRLENQGLIMPADGGKTRRVIRS